jgi:hypothetical protein
VLSISPEALRIGCDRARDLFMLNRLQGPEAAAGTLTAVFDGLGIDDDMREELERALADLVPVKGLPALEAAASSAMLAGVLVGLLIADGTMPGDELDVPVARS